MNNLIIGLLLLYLIYSILCNSIESFDLYQPYKYPSCESCTTDSNEIKCINCKMYLAQNGIKQPTNTYYKKVTGSKKRSLKVCQEEPECKIVDYDTHNNMGYLSKKKLNDDCLFKQSSDKYIHFTKLSTKMQNINSTLNKLPIVNEDIDIDDEDIDIDDEESKLTEQTQPVEKPTPVDPPKPSDPKLKYQEIFKCPEIPKCPDIPRPRGISRIVKRKRCRKKQ